MSTDVAELLTDFMLPEKVATLQGALETERERRERLYDEITDEKAEFINGEVIRHSPAKARHLRSHVRIAGACEILSDSTEHRDRGVKFRDDAANGVGEYWIIDAGREVFEQYLPREAENLRVLRALLA